MQQSILLSGMRCMNSTQSAATILSTYSITKFWFLKKMPVFPGCQSLSRHLSDGVKRPVPLCHRHSPAGNPCAIVALLALGSSSQKRGLRVAGDSNPCAYLQTTANLSHFVVHFLSPPRTGYSIGAPPFCSMFTYRRMTASAPSYVWVCITSRIICPATNSA